MPANPTALQLNLAADEAGFPLDNHIAAIRLIRENGGQVIACAGEALGADSDSETLNKLQVSRIGHGVGSSEDSKVIELTHRVATANIQLSR